MKNQKLYRHRNFFIRRRFCSTKDIVVSKPKAVVFSITVDRLNSKFFISIEHTCIPHTYPKCNRIRDKHPNQSLESKSKLSQLSYHSVLRLSLSSFCTLNRLRKAGKIGKKAGKMRRTWRF